MKKIFLFLFILISISVDAQTTYRVNEAPRDSDYVILTQKWRAPVNGIYNTKWRGDSILAWISRRTVTILDTNLHHSYPFYQTQFATAALSVSLTCQGSQITGFTSGSIVSGNVALEPTLTIGNGQIDSVKIQSGQVYNSHIANGAAIALAKMATGTSAQLVAAGSTGTCSYKTLAGDITLSYSGPTFTSTIGASKVNSSKIADSTIVNNDISPSAGIVLTKLAWATTNNDATAGSLGEYVSSLIASGSAVALTSTIDSNITSISLTAGDWDVEGNVNYYLTGATCTQKVCGITSTSATVPTDGSEVDNGTPSTALTANDGSSIPRKRFSLASTTTIYLVADATFSLGTIKAGGTITARRVR